MKEGQPGQFRYMREPAAHTTQMMHPSANTHTHTHTAGSWGWGWQDHSSESEPYLPRVNESLGAAHVLEALLEGAGLERKQAALVEELGGLPQLRVHAGEQARVAGEPGGLGDAKGVAQNNVLPVAHDGIAADGVGVVGDQVAAAVHGARGVGPGTHGVDGLKGEERERD